MKEPLRKKSLLFNPLIKTVLFLFLIFPSSSAQAQTWIEPSIGYLMGGTTFKGTTGSANGTAFDLKLGYGLSQLYAGLEGTYALPALQNDGSGQPTDSKQFQLGVVIGAELPLFPIRIWLNYSFLNHLSVDSGGQALTLEGMVVKLGAGMKILPFMSGNIEYHMGFYTHRTYGTGPLNGTSEDLTGYRHQSVLVSVSIPIDLPF